MAQASKPRYNSKPNKNKKAPAPAAKQQQASLFETLDKWANAKSFGITIAAFAIAVIFSLILFQARMDIGGDDSDYILRAYDFIHKGDFPHLQGPLYPMFLSIFISIFGIKILLLKFLSVVFNFFSLLFFYKTFKNRFPPLIFFSVLLLTAINAYILTFASLTYSEACFMFLQSLIFFYFFKLIDKLKDSDKTPLKETYPEFLLTALFVFLLSLSRSIGLFALPGLLAFFVLRKQFRSSIYFAGSFAIFYLFFEFIKKFIMHVTVEWGSERALMLYKNQYNPGEGMETLSGFGSRFITNSNLYLSKRFFQVIGLRSPDATNVIPALTFLIVVLCFFALYRAVKSKNRYLLAIVIYIGAMLASTFIAAQTNIDQPRLVMVYVPLLFIMFFYAFYDVLRKASWVGQSFLIIVMIIVSITGLSNLVGRAKANLPILSKNLGGDMLYGFTPDWVNYIKMSQWCADNLPKDALVATRKAEISFMYTDKEVFYPVYKVTSTDPDTVLARFKKFKVNYVMLASLRANSNAADGNIITTLWRIMQPVAEKYPKKLKLIHKEGTAEPAYLYQIIY